MLAAPTEEPLSLATFEPNRTYAPYLNTPRSLEACRLNGVNPIELVELPISEFQKDFPNDPDAAQRRFERIDGARRRVLASVIMDWRRLCENNWAPTQPRPKSAKESILNVPVDSHCTLLELQAAKFRKLEAENYKYLQRLLKIEIKKADAEVKGKKILEKHDELQENNDSLKKDREERRRLAVHEMMERQRKKEEDFKTEIKMLQEIDAEYAKKMAEEKAAKAARDKLHREQCEIERQQRSEYTRHMKDSIINAIENKVENRKKTLELRDKSIEERMKETRELTIKQKADRAKDIEDRLKKAKDEVLRREEEDKQLTLQRMRENEEYRQKIIESRDSQRREHNSTQQHLDRIKKIKEDTEIALEEKTLRIKKEIELKEELSRQELGKLKDAQSKRKCIKSIKQESFDMSSMRARKAHEYKMAKLRKEIQDKDMRSNAIKKGFQVLNQMRSSMKDIVYSTTLILKDEMHRLKHQDQFNPERVVEKALSVSKSALFPRLENIFGMERPKEEEVALTSSDIFAFDFSDSAMLAKADEFINTAEADPNPKNNTTTRSHTGPKIDKSLLRLDRTDLPIPRKGFATMPITTFTAEKLANALIETKDQVTDPNPPSESPYHRNNSRSSSPVKPSNKSTNYYSDEDEENEQQEDNRVDNRVIATASSKHRSDAKHSQPVSHAHTVNDVSSHKSILRLDEDYDRDQHHHNERDPRALTAPAVRSQKTLQPITKHTSQSKRDDDIKLPVFPFNPPALRKEEPSPSRSEEVTNREGSLKEDNNQGINETNDFNLSGSLGSNEFKNTAKTSATRKKIMSAKRRQIRTDVNEKAKFLDPPTGTFRREFSLDHPLAAGGAGKYDDELKRGIKPTGLSSDIVKAYSSVSAAIDLSNKVEKLTYAAQNNIVDHRNELEKLKKTQNEILKKILDEERLAEEMRAEVSKTITEESEKMQIDHVFAEERKRANERIIQATKNHENTIKNAVLHMMNLGTAK